MKKYSILVALFASTLFASCMKDNETKFEGDFVEMDAAVYTANSAGVTYPIITRLPGYGQPIISANIAASGSFPAIPADPLITRASGTIKFRVNLVGPQRSTATTVSYTAAGFGTNPAVAGTHFTTGNTVEIPANSSFGEISVQIINPGVASATARDFVITLTGASNLPPSENEKSVGIRISQL
ncbi:MAG: hypothetical protein V4687_13450 [Bacteroidota bacterium]